MSCFSWLTGAKQEAPPPAAPKAIGDQAKRMSQDLQRKKADSEEDFNLRLQGYDDDDPVIMAAKLERAKSRSQEMERKKKEEEEAFQRRLERM
jgi:hypothetical protein